MNPGQPVAETKIFGENLETFLVENLDFLVSLFYFEPTIIAKNCSFLSLWMGTE